MEEIKLPKKINNLLAVFIILCLIAFLLIVYVWIMIGTGNFEEKIRYDWAGYASLGLLAFLGFFYKNVHEVEENIKEQIAASKELLKKAMEKNRNTKEKNKIRKTLEDIKTNYESFPNSGGMRPRVLFIITCIGLLMIILLFLFKSNDLAFVMLPLFIICVCFIAHIVISFLIFTSDYDKNISKRIKEIKSKDIKDIKIKKRKEKITSISYITK